MRYGWTVSFRASLFLAIGSLAWWSGAAACSGNNAVPAVETSGIVIAATAGAGGSSGCNGFHPDGYCVAFGPSKESCACLDCAAAAICTTKCKDDGKCARDMGEDCTCADCFDKVQKCAPPDQGCKDDGACAFNENCVCKDCSGTDFCKQHCEDNGECVRWLEGCECADCNKKVKECGGVSSASSSSASSSSANSSSSSSATAGAGGGGGAGGK